MNDALQQISRAGAALTRLPAAVRRYAPYVLVALCLLAILVFGDKYWDANDDEHMAMIARGYGLADAPSAGLVYSNVAWGWLVMQLGAPFGIPGYTLGAYAVLLGSAAAIAWVLLKRDTPGLLAATLLLAMFIRPLLEPQFSITAGYAAAAGMALLLSCERSPRWSTAACAALFLVLGGLIRFPELLFVGLVSAPFLLHALYRNRSLPASRWMLAALLVMLAALGGARLLDSHYRSGDAWQHYDEVNALRKPLTDYGLAGYFLNREQRLQDVGLNRNDMQLMSNWFFLDATVYNQQTLGTLLQDLPWSERLSYNLSRYAALPGPFTTELVALLGLAALLSLALSGRRRLAAAGLAMFALSMFIFLCMGRPGVPRVLPGALAALAVLAALDDRYGRRPWAVLITLVLLCGVCLDGADYLRVHHRQAARAASVKHDMCELPGRDQLQVVWGAPRGFPDRYVYDPTQDPAGDCMPHIYLVGVLGLQPANLQQLHAYTRGRDLVPALLGGQHFYFLTTPDRLALLDRFLHDHYGVRLHSEASFDRAGATQYRVWVEGAKPPAS
ncbi:MAG TPA: hypothetical protein VGM16_00555 [Gammaproteobacteria bacterium]